MPSTETDIAAGILIAALLLSGCSGPVNSPHLVSENGKRLFYAPYTERPSHLDPVRAYNANEYTFIGQIYEPPLQYHYLKRPYELIPLTAESLPRVRYYDNQKRLLSAGAEPSRVARSEYEIRIKPGIRYQPHPAFAQDANGRAIYYPMPAGELAKIDQLGDFEHRGSRELTAADYVYQIKRLADPSLHSPIRHLMSTYIIGFEDLGRELAAVPRDKSQWTDLRKYRLSGVELVDGQTYRISLKGKYPQFVYWLAMPFFAPVPWEVDAFFSQPGMRERDLTLDAWPVGTGPFMMINNEPAREIRLAANPSFRGEAYPGDGEKSDVAAGYLRDAGESMPFIDGAVYTLEKESIPLWLKFLQGYYDTAKLASDNFDQAIQNQPSGLPELSAEMYEREIVLKTQVAPTTWYMGFNMLDPIVGGLGVRNQKLRLAISIALDMEEYVSIFMNGRGLPAQGPIPPGVAGFLDGAEGINTHVYEWEGTRPKVRSIEYAKNLLSDAGYPDGRKAESGKPLILHLDIAARGADDKARLDWFRKRLDKLGVQLIVRNTDYNRFQEKMRKGQAQLFEWAWNADYPDAENFLFLFYGQNGKVKTGGENNANYQNVEFDTLFRRMKLMNDTPAREAVIRRMVAILQHDAPWIYGYHPAKFTLHQGWLTNDKPNPMAWNTLKYLRVDAELRAQQQTEWNRPSWSAPILIVGLLVVVLLLGRKVLVAR